MRLFLMEIGKLNRKAFLAVTVAVIANLLLGNIVLAKEFDITDKEVGQIRNGLDLMKLMVNLSLNDNKLKAVLNTVISGGRTGTDVTYGLLVLTSFNEMEFIDMVISQKYKKEATAYFESILDDRTNLRNYYKGIGYDLPRVVMGKITSPVGALTLNTFEITDKAIQIFTVVNVLKRELLYDGLWRYFDSRHGGEDHQRAWEDARIEMFLKLGNQSKLESQFATLYEKWGPYTDEKGVKEDYKRQVREELKNTITLAINEQKLAEEEVREKREASFLEKISDAFYNLTKEMDKIGGSLANKINQIGERIRRLSKAGGAQISQVSQITQENMTKIEPSSLNDEEVEPLSFYSSSQKNITKVEPLSSDDDINEVGFEAKLEEMSEIAKDIQSVSEEMKETAENMDITTETETSGSEIGKSDLLIAQTEDKSKNALCEKVVGQQPLRLGMIFQEIAWMGNQNSVNDEWMRLKNIANNEIDLTNWQIQDKDRQIKIIFEENLTSIISAKETFILERTDDESLPGEAADLIYTGALNDTDEALYLFDSQCQLQDEIIADSGWPGGDKSIKEPMKRSDNFNWQVVFNYGASISAPLPQAVAETPITMSVENILLSEIQISPIGSRFIELYNPNNTEVDLSGWYIQRKTQTGDSWNSLVSSTYFEGKTIGAEGYFLIASSSQADINLSLTLTGGNSLILKNSSQEIIDKVGWGQAQEYETATATEPVSEQSIGRRNNIDTDNNQSDFELKTIPSPTNSSDDIVAFFVSEEEEENATTAPAVETPTFSVVINEIAWAGTRADSSDEWIELYNNATSVIDITGWTLNASDTSPSIAFSTSTIPAQSYFLLERTNASTTNIAEDYIFTGALGNNGEKLELRDASNTLIDLVDFSSGWPSGSSSPNYISMERISATTSGTSSVNWASNNLLTRNGLDVEGDKINGTPKSQNSVSVSSTTISSFSDLFNEFSEITLTLLGSPYIITADLIVPAGKSLFTESGASLKFNQDKKLTVQGELKANGATFTANSDSPDNNFWKGIYFANAVNSRVENSLIKYAKNGLELYSGNHMVKNNDFQNNETPVLLHPNASSTFSGNTTQANDVNGILLPTSTVVADTVWQSDANLPFVIDYTKAVGENATLTIKEGTVVKIKPQTGSNWTGNFDISGRLVIEGSASNPVILTSFKDDEYGGDTNNDGTTTVPIAGSWKYLRFRSAVGTSTLDNAIIRYGAGNCDGAFCWGAIRQDQGSGIEIINSRIEKNIWGIFSAESLSDCASVFNKIRLENTVFSQNQINIRIENNQCVP